jgi:hypothetical protein
MSVDCMIEDKRWAAVDLEGLADAAAAATFAHLGLSGYEVSLLGCNDARIADLNADFRGKPTPTNVLSWPSDERGADLDGGQPLPPDALIQSWAISRLPMILVRKRLKAQGKHWKITQPIWSFMEFCIFWATTTTVTKTPPLWRGWKSRYLAIWG